MSRVIWITGASSGIGRALVETASEDDRIIGIARRPSPKDESLLADLGDPDSWDDVSRSIEAVLTEARPSEALLLHFAGAASPTGPVGDVDEPATRSAVLLNSASGQVLGTAFLGACARQGVSATVVMCSSPGAVHPQAGMAHYSAGKAALEMWARTVGLEQQTSTHPAKVFSIVPYAVDTPMVRSAMEEPLEVLPVGQFFREAAAAGGLVDPASVAREIWGAIELGVEQGSAVAVGAVPSAA